MATFSKTSTFEAPKFSQSLFPLRFDGFCLRLGLRLPRRHAAAFGSMEGCRADRAAAPRGQGGPGCEEQHGPWPRTRIWGETLLRHGIFNRGSG